QGQDEWQRLRAEQVAGDYRQGEAEEHFMGMPEWAEQPGGCRQQAKQGQYRPGKQDRSVERCGGKEPGIGEGQARLARAHGLSPVKRAGWCLLAYAFQRPASRSLPRWTAARTCAGAVPPMWSRAFTEPSRVSTANTSSVI